MRSQPRFTSRPHTALRVGLVGLFVALLTMATGTAPMTVDERVDEIIRANEAESALWGIYVQDINTGRAVYYRNADRTMLPASNQKLLTSATALDALGSDFRYETTLHFNGAVADSVLRGDLILEGSGDPTFGSTEIYAADPLRAWAKKLSEMGVRRIEGRLIGDDDVFDEKPYAKGWDIDYVASQASRALGISASGLSYFDNLVQLKVEAERVGQAPTVSMRPLDYLEIDNDATTSGRRRGRAVRLQRQLGTEQVRLYGTIPRTYAGTIELPISNPTVFTLETFRSYLEEEGITFDADVIDIDDLDEEPDYQGAAPLFVHLSPPLSRILEVVNKESNNFYAEQVFRSFGWGGSADGAEQRIKQLLERAGASTDGLAIRDGSGLSRKDLVTPEALGQLLTYMYQHEEREAFLASLPQGGEPSTTLRYRLADVPVRAKTGSLEFVRALSGYTTTPDGRPLAFSILANNYTVPSYRIMQTIDEIVMMLASEQPG